MKKWIVVVLASLLSVLAVPCYAGEIDKISYQRALDDGAIESDFEEGLRWQDRRFETARIKAKAFNGYVIIYGEVPESDMIALAEEHTKNLKTVRRVFSQIQVRENKSLNTIDDLLLTVSIKTYLLTSINIDATKIRYDVDDGTVYLMGLLTSQEAENTVALVKQLKSVDKVVTLFEYIQ